MQDRMIKKYSPFPTVDLPDRTWPERTIDRAPLWCSVDLRDGNQALVNPMNVGQKLELFKLLVSIGLKEIEIGFPAASRTEYDFTRLLIEEDLIPEDVTIQVLTQARHQLIEKSFEALRGVRRAIVHLYNSTSTLQREVVFRKNRRETIELALSGVTAVRECAAATDTEIVFEYSPESFTGTESDFAVEICDRVLDEWDPAPDEKVILNLPATVEMSTPNIYADQIEWFSRHLSRPESALISLHTHNDRGTAVAATELGLMAGAGRVEGTLFGNGERTGNVDIVTLALNMYSQGIDPGLDLHNLGEIIRVSEKCTGIPVHIRHPYAGDLVYTAFSGSHQDAISKGMAHQAGNRSETWEVPYLPIDPTDLGRSYEAIIRINSQSGKGGVSYILKERHGIEIPALMQPEFARIIQERVEETGLEITPDEIFGVFRREYLECASPFEFVSFQTGAAEKGGDKTRCLIVLRIQKEERTMEGNGNGPIDACREALRKGGINGFVIESYHEHSLNRGSDSQAIAFIQIRNAKGAPYFGAGIDTNITLASIKALLSALNRSRKG